MPVQETPVARASPEMAPGQPSCALSVIIATQGAFEPLRRSVRGLAAQTAARDIELIIVAPSRTAISADRELLEAFAAFRIVEAGEAAPVGRATAAGVRAACAPVVAMSEDHVLLDRGWAEGLIAAHRGPWASVAGVIRNANPATATSWADMFISYGKWLEPVTAGPAEFLPGHNASYKRDVLLSYGDRLEALLQVETVLHWAMRADGHELYLEPAVRLSHINFSRFTVLARVQFHAGRNFGAARAAQWSLAKRLCWVAASPAIPAVRLGRIVRSAAAKPGLFGKLLYAFPVICVGLACDGFGQMLGYAFGAGASERKIAQYEYRRERFLSRRDRKALGALDG